jgi:hypothetical protein
MQTLLPGADNHVHVGLFIGLRSHGAVLSATSPPADGSWTWTGYPSGFHALLATISELLDPKLETGAASVLSYTHALAAVVVLSMVVFTAAVVSIGGLRRRPLLAFAVLVPGWSAFLWDPGQKALANGFGNFWFAAAAAAVALVLAFHPIRPFDAVHAAAVCSLLVGVAHGWLLLVVPAAPAALSVLTDAVLLFKRGGLSRKRAAGLVLVATACGTASLQAFLLARGEKTVGQLVSEPGGMNGTSPLPTFALLLVALGVYPILMRRLRNAWPGDGIGRTDRPWVIIAAALAGTTLGATLLIAQLESTGTTSYYFLKYFMGLELILAACVPICIAVVVAALVPAHRWLGVNAGVAVAGAFLASQTFGALHHGTALLVDDNDGGTANIHGPYSRESMSEGILRASQGRHDLLFVDYLAVGKDGAVQAFYPDGWFHAMDASLTSGVYERLALMRRPVDTEEDAAVVARQLLQQDPRVRVVVAPEHLRAIRTALRDSGLGDRVTTWSSGK